MDADIIKDVDHALAVSTLCEINDHIVAKGDQLGDDELALLAQQVLEIFALLTPAEKKIMLAALDPSIGKAVGKARGKAQLLSEEMRGIPADDDSLAQHAYRRMKVRA